MLLQLDIMGFLLDTPGFEEDVAPRLDVKGKHVFVNRVEGDSMVPALHPDDELVINPERAFTNFKGGFGVVKYDDSLTSGGSGTGKTTTSLRPRTRHTSRRSCR